MMLRRLSQICNQMNPAQNRNFSGMIFKQLFDHESSTFTYLISSGVGKPAIIIDPVLEQVERDLKLVKELGIDLKYAMNTHCHADHITGTGKIKSFLPNVQSIISKASLAKADVLIQPNDVITVGDIEIKALATPGHTDGCMSFYIKQMSLVMTGDALLIRGCGRTDFQGGSSDTLYESVHNQLYSLPGDTLVYPAHDYKGMTSSSIEEEMKFNPRLTKSKQEFKLLMAGLNLPYPKKIDASLPANLKCGLY